MKIFILMDCSGENQSKDLIGVPVGVYESLDRVLVAIELRSEDYGYYISKDHFVVEMETDRHYAVDEARWLTVNEVIDICCNGEGEEEWR